MSELNEPAPSPGRRQAGDVIKDARMAQEMQIAALAAAIKVPVRKLEALESSRWEELGDATFARALAQTVCRALRLDPVPVLAMMPGAAPKGLVDWSSGINVPFVDRSGRSGSWTWHWLIRPVFWGPLAIILLAAAVYFMPSEWIGGSEPSSQGVGSTEESSQMLEPHVDASVAAVGPASAVDSALSVASLSLPLAASAQAPKASVPPASQEAAAMAQATPTAQSSTPPASRAAAGFAAPASGPLSSPVSAPGAIVQGVAALPPRQAAVPGQLVSQSGMGSNWMSVELFAREDAWIQIKDAQGRVLLSRMVKGGESIPVQGAGPMQAVVGNATQVKLTVRGQPFDLKPLIRDNVARPELK